VRKLSLAAVASGAAVVTAVVAGCGGSGGAPPPAHPNLSPAIDPAGAHVAYKVSRLVGNWAVHAVGEPRTTVLRIAADEVAVWRSCGPISGSWVATLDGAFVASLSGGSEPCFRRTPHVLTTVPWLARARGYAIDNARRWRLLTADGAVLAVLTPGATPVAPQNIAQSEADPPTLTAEQRRHLNRTVAPLPPGTTAATTRDLVGTWAPPGDRKGSIRFRSNGTYSGTDGCNGQGGRWEISTRGILAVTEGPTTLVYCGGVQVADWFGSAARVAVDGDTLVLYDARGNVTHKVRRTR